MNNFIMKNKDLFSREETIIVTKEGESYIKQMYDEYVEKFNEHSETVKELQQEIRQIEGRIADLQAEIDNLECEQQDLEDEKERLTLPSITEEQFRVQEIAKLIQSNNL